MIHTYRLAPKKAASATAKTADALHQPVPYVTKELVADVFDSFTRGRQDLSACFTGHRRIPREAQEFLPARLDALLRSLYDGGVRDFYCGGALGFDTLAAEAVVRLREIRPEVRLLLVLPCADQSARWNDDACRQYERILYLADQTHVLSPFYYRGCMQVRNRFMVDRSRICICYMTHLRGGTVSTVNYAMDEGRQIINLAMPDALPHNL